MTIPYSAMFEFLAAEQAHHETIVPHVSALIAAKHRRDAEVCSAISDVLAKYREITKARTAA